jgi:lysophospholipase L1-like esterase
LTVKTVGEKYLLLGDSMVRNVGAGKQNMRVEGFPGIIADQLRRVMENRDLGHSDAVVILVGTNDIRRSRNLGYIMGEVYDLVNTAKTKFPGSRIVLSGVLRSKEVTWRRVGAANDRLEWVARCLGATFVDPNSWIRELDFGRDGLHLNRNGARELGDLYSRVCGIDGEIWKVLNN